MDAGYGWDGQPDRHHRRRPVPVRERETTALTREQVEERLRAITRDHETWPEVDPQARAVVDTLRRLAQHGWTTLHDVRLPAGGRAVEHVALGPGGVVVIEPVRWAGPVTAEHGVLRHEGRRRDEPIETATAQARAIADLVGPEHRSAVTATVCVVGHDLDAAPVGGTTVVGQDQLLASLTALPARLTPYDVADLGRHLQSLLGDRTQASPAHVPTPRRRTVAGWWPSRDG